MYSGFYCATVPILKSCITNRPGKFGIITAVGFGLELRSVKAVNYGSAWQYYEGEGLRSCIVFIALITFAHKK